MLLLELGMSVYGRPFLDSQASTHAGVDRRILRMKSEIETSLLMHADREAPRECCGLLVGRHGVVEEHYRLPNNSPDGERSYFAEPKAMVAAMCAIRNSRMELLGIYHSHPKTSPTPSPTDIEQAYYPDCAYIIVGTGEEGMRIKAYRIEKGLVSELVVEWVEKAAIVKARPS